MSEEIVDQVMEEKEKGGLNAVVAVLVTVTATFLAICHVKSENIVQKMHELDAQMVDQWNYFQAKSTKQKLEEMAAEQIGAMKDVAMFAYEAKAGTTPGTVPGEIVALGTKAEKHLAEAERYAREKKEEEAKAKVLAAQKRFLEVNDDQFDLSDALLSISLSVFAMTALTKRRWLLGIGTGFMLIGIGVGTAGLADSRINVGGMAEFLRLVPHVPENPPGSVPDKP